MAVPAQETPLEEIDGHYTAETARTYKPVSETAKVAGNSLQVYFTIIIYVRTIIRSSIVYIFKLYIWVSIVKMYLVINIPVYNKQVVPT
ncbi:MAG: hypothetical protein A2431_00295 [Candidatus Zambryskibacteria bacterium RIFOXYC1_FULL_39_10]|uniref:Uncharacterized protein n=1 Tax=Candidatus Zambryskibacteria bacterium RIFOXYC1_FULL_39_10 TaxID=1802779 RepID=A0A1G2UZF6_9BACT|nr:MAG: hypothetical protein A2431_00295 [Candidatus Zambryskibacteria bacterium RIFOXYC1_FULL_39_10]OHB15986.1 MAG: hypothetical protein A2605_03835 [Candidatus Zambryskibacteria bacterium RIFOXYD1_FULL_39_35]